MYILYKEKKYSCTRLENGRSFMIYRALPEDFPAPIDGEMVLYTDKDFKLRTENADKWLRQTFTNGILAFTNTPEPIPNEEELPSSDPGPVTWDELAAAYAEGVNSIDE